MRFRYTISFKADGVDDRAFLNALKGLGAAEISIARYDEKQVSRRPGKIHDAILSILKDDKPHRRRDIIEAACSRGLSYTGVNNALARMVAAGEIVCFRHGLYGSLRTSLASAAVVPPRINRLKEKSSFTRVVELIQGRPQTAFILREQVPVSRQRMEQILRKAESQKLIKRISTEFGERGKYAYVAVAAANEIKGPASTLIDRRRQLLSSLAPGKLYYGKELASFFGVPATSQITDALAELTRLGLVSTLSVGIKTFCSLTPSGASHGDYDMDAPKAPPVDLVGEIGVFKSKYLQAMKVLGGSARTVDLTYAVGETVANGARRNSGQMMQMLQEIHLVQRPQNRAIRQSAYSLTESGHQVAALLDRYIEPPERATLEARIATRTKLKADTLRGVVEQTHKRKVTPQARGQ